MFKILYKKDLQIVTVCVGLLLIGCSRNDRSAGALPEVLPPDKAGTNLEHCFRKEIPADPAVQEQIKIAVTSLKNNDYLPAYDALRRLKGASRSLTADQDMAVRNALLGLFEAVARGVAEGDQKAIAIAGKMSQ